MEEQIRAFLAQHWNAEKANQLGFSPVPKGQPGDRAMTFFDLAKTEKISPVALAQQVSTALQSCDIIEKTSPAGPYLNLFFHPAAYFKAVLAAPIHTTSLSHKKVLVEYSGPNTNKPLHLGHMRNHALGISVSNLLEKCGANVKRVNIINDRGVHICKSMLAYQRYGNGETPSQTGEKSDHFVGRFYVMYSQKEKEKPALKDEIQTMLQAWEAGDADIIALWKKMNDWALSGHITTYERQGVHFDQDYKESDYYVAGKELAEEGLEKGPFYRRDDGAIMVDLEAQNMDQKVILRADGTSIYLTQDLGVAAARKADHDPTDLIYIVADEQNYHFKVLFHCLEKLGILPLDHLTHLGYGLVHLPEGRMKSREGTVVDADDLMDQLSNEAKNRIIERNEDMTDAEAHAAAEAIMNAAWKCALLSTSPRKSITYDAQKSMQFEGSTGPYLQYAGVRIRGLFRKAELDINTSIQTDYTHYTDEEKELGAKILKFVSVLDRAGESLNPTYVVTYLFELTQAWSSFYAQSRILDAATEVRTARLALAQKVFSVLETGLGTLGITVPERM